MEMDENCRQRAARLVKNMTDSEAATRFNVPAAYVSLARRADWYCPEYVVGEILKNRVQEVRRG